MTSLQGHDNIYRRIVNGTGNPALEVLGPTVEILTLPDEAGADGLCVMRVVVPPGVVVPLHSHEDAETFFIVDGTQRVLTQGEHGLEWSDARAGDYVNIPPRTSHAHRNVSQRPAVDLIITTVRMGRFFQEVGKPATDPPQPPTPDDIARFVATAARYGYTLATPEENHAVGIELPKF